MFYMLSLRIMRTTINIDDPILKDLKKIQKREGKSLGRLISDLLAQALGTYREGKSSTATPTWFSKDMGARVDLSDREALYTAMDLEEDAAESPENR
jgi:hypothetical protein